MIWKHFYISTFLLSIYLSIFFRRNDEDGLRGQKQRRGRPLMIDRLLRGFGHVEEDDRISASGRRQHFPGKLERAARGRTNRFRHARRPLPAEFTPTLKLKKGFF